MYLVDTAGVTIKGDTISPFAGSLGDTVCYNTPSKANVHVHFPVLQE